MEIFEITELELVDKINLGINRKQWDRVSSQILHKDRAFLQNFWKCQNWRKCLGVFIGVDFSNSFDLVETAVMAVFEVAEFETVIKIEAAPFLVTLGPIFAQNLGITREWWVIQARRRLHRVSRRILLKGSALSRSNVNF